MIGKDFNASYPFQYRTWVVDNEPDFAAQYYMGPKAGSNPLIDVVAYAVNDASAIVWFSYNQYPIEGQPRLVILDYEAIQLDAFLLVTRLPSWIERGHELASQCNARGGFVGIAIEDAASGIVLNQAARANRLPVIPINSRWTCRGKDERALLASSPYVQGQMKISQFAHDKTINLKGVTKNHCLDQFLQFKVGDKHAANRADDLLDCLTYGLMYADNNLAEWN